MKRVYTLKEKAGKDGLIFSWQKCNGNYIATTGRDQIVHIYDRYGEPKERISLPGQCIGLEWDKDGDLIAVVCDQSPMIYLWNSNTGRHATIDTGLRDTLSLLLWSKGAPILAVGTNKGNLLIYNHQTSRKVPILGKHNKKITCGAWSQQNLLALGSTDKTLTISNLDGDNVRQCAIRGEISLIQFSEMKHDEKSSGQNTVSLIIDKETMYLYNIYDPENPVELAFQPKYGKICDYKWYGDGYIAIGFSHGYFIVISTHMKEIGQELYQVRNHKDFLSGVAISPKIQKAVSIGDNSIRVHELQDFENIYAITNLDDESKLDRIDWTDDGQLIAVSTSKGNIHVYLTKLPVLGDVCGTQLAYLTSLLEVSIFDKSNSDLSVSLVTEIEPGFIALGAYHLAIGMNNCAWFYYHTDEGFELFLEKEYLGTVQSMKLNMEYAAVLFDGKVQLHIIEPSQDRGQHTARIFPSDDDDSNSGGDLYKIMSISLTQEFLIYSTDHGAIYFFYMQDWAFVNEYRHHCAINNLFVNSSSSCLIFMDEKSDAYIYNPINDQTLIVPDLPPSIESVIWESTASDSNIFIINDKENIYTYVNHKESIEGPQVKLIGQTKLPVGQVPKMLYGGDTICQTQSSKISIITLSSHGIRDRLQDMPAAELKELLSKDLGLGRMDDAWIVCQILDNSSCWESLARTAVFLLKVDFAMKVYRKIKNVGMVWSLQGIQNIEDRSLLSGYLAMYLGNFNMAQDLFLNSSNPVTALEMRRDLLHWDQALNLANKLAPQQIPFISREYAMQLEFVGDYPNALLHYEKGLMNNKDQLDHDNACNAGIARMSIRCGDITRGVSLAKDMEGRMLKRECAEILENMKQYNEAALLYERGNYFDKAAMLYIRLKNWSEVKELLPNITSNKIFSQYAKAKEMERNYEEAAKAYRSAQDYENLIRILLDNMNDPDEAVKVVKECNSIEGAKKVAQFFQKLNDYRSAIKFLIMSKCNDEAFQLAQSHNIMDLYADIISDTADATLENYHSIAVHFETNKNYLMAGKFYLHAKAFPKAMHHLLKAAASEDNKALQLAVETAGAANDNQLTMQLIDFLMGEHDGIPKDFKYLFRLYMILKQYKEAAKTAIIIAREEQNAGNYRNSHDLLFSMYQELRKNKIKIPSEMNVNLMILHSYLLVRIHVKRGDHMTGARMLIRVANSISKFPSHIVPILTSTVIECHRSGLKNSSFSYAAMLMRPEYRNQIDLKYKKKIEAIVRKPTKVEEDESMSPCPFCNTELADTELICSECKNSVPFCIASGRHLLKEDFTLCPHCKFPAIMSQFVSLLSSHQNCPMCSESLEASDLNAIPSENVLSILNENEFE